eukprot:1563055-Lingulodinium_polyedra.AAC.1
MPGRSAHVGPPGHHSELSKAAFPEFVMSLTVLGSYMICLKTTSSMCILIFSTSGQKAGEPQ